MKSKLEIHPIQANIVTSLLFFKQARFSQLNKAKISTDQFNFHLKALLDSELVTKSKEGYYSLTLVGKEFAGRLDTKSSQIEKQAKVSVVIYCSKHVGKQKKYLLQQRLKHPYYGFIAPIGGKIRWGETIYEAAHRELKEETNLETTGFTLMRVKHKMDYQKTGELLEDKYFFVLRAGPVRGELLTNFKEGRNLWLSQNEIKKLTKVFPDFDKSMKGADQKVLNFLEDKYTVEGF